MDSKEYFARRAVEREQRWNAIATRELQEKVRLYYEQSLEQIQRDIAALYAKYATENGLTMAEARKLIRGDEFKVWRMTLEEYVKAAKTDSAILKELNTLAMRSRISRFEALHARTLMEIADLCEKLNQFEDALQYRAYVANFYGNLYDIHKQYGLSTPPVAVDKKQAENAIRTPWSGANYSTRIWNNGSKLEKAIETTILTAIHRGSSIQKLSKDLSQQMNVAYNNAERLIRTELNFVQTRAAADSIIAAEMGYYQFIAVMDNRTTPMCQSLDGEIFPIVELNQGENAPPMHVRCRSTICASIDDGKQGRKPTGQRAARDEDGKRIKIPADMRYADWKAVYIDKTKTLDDWRKTKDAEYKAQSAAIQANKNVSTKNVTASSRNPTDFPVLNCKNFSELQRYWANNYNVKVVNSIEKLHFKSVREVMGGVEAVIKEFPIAVTFLQVFDTRRLNVMTTEYGGRYIGKPNKINFNPDYFDKVEHLKDLIMDSKTGYHPKNTGLFETGAHEMAHIIEDWLVYKYNGTFQELKNRVFARKIIQDAFSRAKLTPEGKGKTITQMAAEISRYAKTNVSECISEAISDYVANGENASILSREIWKRIKEELN